MIRYRVGINTLLAITKNGEFLAPVMKKTWVLLPNDIHETLQRLAIDKHLPVSGLILQAIEQVYANYILRADVARKPLTNETPQGRPQSHEKPPARIGVSSRSKRRTTVTPLKKSGSSTAPTHSSKATPVELHIRRLPVEEATYRLDKYLDAAFMSGHKSVRIIHGKGTGTLRKVVWDRLDNHSLVETYRIADSGEGDTGVTIVQLADR